MTFRGKMHDRVRLEVLEKSLHRGRVGDVRLLEAITVAARNRLKRIEVSGIGKFIDDQYLVRRVFDQVADDGGSDKARTASHQKPL